MSLRALQARSNLLLKKGHPFLVLILLVSAFLNTSCAEMDIILATPTYPIPTEAPSATPTYNWFPASQTPSPVAYSTHVPTPDMRPGLGAVTLTDQVEMSLIERVLAS